MIMPNNAKFKSAANGTFKFGCATLYGVEPLIWRKLREESDGRILVISEYIISAMPMQPPEEYVSESDVWRESIIRKWLNTEFFKLCFDEDEQSQIAETRLDDTGTTDRIFLLSSDEVEQTMPLLSDRQASGTAWAKSNGLWCSELGDRSRWWLRTSAKSSVSETSKAVSGNGETNCALLVCGSGEIESGYCWKRDVGVRPAMYLKL